MKRAVTCSVLTAAIAFAGAAAAPQASATIQTPKPISVTSPTIKEGAPIPLDHTADGKNVSPALAWTGAPAGTKEFALICEDPDAPTPQPFVHWVAYKIPATAKGLPEQLPTDPAAALPADLTGMLQGNSGFRRPGYFGPRPPAGKVHHYHFIVYALDAPVDLPAGATKAQLVEAMKGHIIGQGELVGTYERK